VQHEPAPDVSFVCPCCKGPLITESSSYACHNCAVNYPILFEIPDFRLRSDRYLNLEEERAKAARLYEFGLKASFEDLIKFYYSITYDLPPDLVLRYQAAIIAAPERLHHIVSDLTPKADYDTLVDVGCGTGGLLVAAQGRYRAIFGVDIALRWLVICHKRLRDMNAKATLVCADVEALPFPSGSFSQAVAADLVEHVYDIDCTVDEISRLLKPQGLLWLSASNRFCLGPHPLTGIWATGFLPGRSRAWVLKKLRGIDLLRFANLVSPGALVARLEKHSFDILQVRPRHVHHALGAGYAPVERGLIALYRFALRFSLMQSLLLRIGPAFEVICRKLGPGSRRVRN